MAEDSGSIADLGVGAHLAGKRGGGGGGEPRAIVNTAVNSGGTAQAASFSVDLDQIPGLIAKYKEAHAIFEEILNKAQHLGSLGTAPGEDEFSKKLENGMRELAVTGPNSLMSAVDDGRQRLASLIDQLEQAQRGYEQADESATPNQM